MYSGDDSAAELITMNYMDTVCNGTRPAGRQPPASTAPVAATTNTSTANLNWLIYAYYARQEFAVCRTIVEQQLRQHADKEFAYRTKGLIERQHGDTVGSLQCLQRAIDLNPANAINYKEIGRTL